MKILYECDFCGENYDDKEKAETHETLCSYRIEHNINLGVDDIIQLLRAFEDDGIITIKKDLDGTA